MLTFAIINNEIWESNVLNKYNINLKNITTIYALKLKEDIIGYGFITSEFDNRIYVYVIKKYRSNGYGKILLRHMVAIIPEKEVFVTIDKSNKYAESLLYSVDALQITSQEHKAKFMIYKK